MAPPADKAHRVRFRRRVHGETVVVSADVADGTTLWDAARAVGLPVASACSGSALCARCGFEILEGADALSAERSDERRAKDRGQLPAAQRLSCQVHVHGDVLATTGYW